jgi:hypothetical protein
MRINAKYSELPLCVRGAPSAIKTVALKIVVQYLLNIKVIAIADYVVN